MLSQCANSACPASFRYLHEGRIFTLAAGPDLAAAGAVRDRALESPVQRYWLCNSCAQLMTVCRVNQRAVVRRLPCTGVPAGRGVAA